MEHDLERKIILKLIHTPHATFNELWNKDGESNKFAYHLNKLVEQGLIGKNGEYSLTSEGRKTAAFIEGETGQKAAFPTLTIILIVWNEDGQILAQKRLKEPFYGCQSFVSGKVNFGLNSIECAKRDLLEETGLEAKEFREIGIEQIKTYENNSLVHHHFNICIEVKGSYGKLIEKTHKAEHYWLLPDEYHRTRSFPETVDFYKWINPKKFWIGESERFMDNGKFIGAKLVNFKEM